ncbi:hypothetical protein AB0A74_11830 [Saccharothrix sp. NPDC042600]|uniref:hypothetical protein n=1 Tax=Saccharothrix TaxID=2071 RepID=UPI00340286D9|nr:hypothetical protein GCM10017745_05840 [Saccharothrix mutabilis subsp. capreolus]
MLADTLARCRAQHVSGTLHLVGDLGGRCHLRQGAVIAADSPGAPGADALLMRSGRVAETDWTAALRAAANRGSHRAELVARGCTTFSELNVTALMVAHDSTFAAVVGGIGKCVLDPRETDVALPVDRGIDPDVLLAETHRRLVALAALRVPVTPHRDRLARLGPPEDAHPGRRAILAEATGRRTARDIAFLVGRGVYAVTVDVSRLIAEGLLEIVPAHRQMTGPPPRGPGARTPSRSTKDTVTATPLAPDAAPTVPNTAAVAPPSDLPRRNAPAPRPPVWQALPRLLGRRKNPPTP